MKGIGELLEGIIPYSQRHFSRIDRLERSTFLLDYTLIGMSVMEPEDDRSKTINSSGKNAERGNPSNDPAEVVKESVSDTEETPQIKGSKKRKSKKSSEVCYKKVKPSAAATAISMPA